MPWFNSSMNDAWAMPHSALETLTQIAQREQRSMTSVMQSMSASMRDEPDNPYEGIQVISVRGPLFCYANIFTRMLLASSYERIQKELHQALNDTCVSAIIFDIDSPGGEVNGCSSLAHMIYEARGTKPMVAFASGDCASGAYWMASACDSIVATDTASLGSIGVVATLCTQPYDDHRMDIVSSQSPHKRLDVSLDDDRARIQRRVDALADVFIEHVARHRNQTPNDIVQHYGGGDVFIGEQAITAGLADRVGTLTSLVNELSFHEAATADDFNPTDIVSVSTETSTMTLDELHKRHPNLRNEIAQQESARIATRIHTILSSEQAKDRSAMAMHLALETQLTPEAALAILEQTPIAQATLSTSEPVRPTTDFASLMQTIENPKVEPNTSAQSEDVSDASSEEVMAKRIANLHVL